MTSLSARQIVLPKDWVKARGWGQWLEKAGMCLQDSRASFPESSRFRNFPFQKDLRMVSEKGIKRL